MTDTISFHLNGELVTLENPAPDLLLIDYLRSPEVGLTGAKKGCGQGGCGACTVILSPRDADTGEFTHRSINPRSRTFLLGFVESRVSPSDTESRSPGVRESCDDRPSR